MSSWTTRRRRGRGSSVVGTLHRIEASALRAAGRGGGLRLRRRDQRGAQPGRRPQPDRSSTRPSAVAPTSSSIASASRADDRSPESALACRPAPQSADGRARHASFRDPGRLGRRPDRPRGGRRARAAGRRAAYAAALADPIRTDADRARDAARHTAETLAFAEVEPGQKIGDMIIGGGYFTRVFAAPSGPTGQRRRPGSPPSSSPSRPATATPIDRRRRHGQCRRASARRSARRSFPAGTGPDLHGPELSRPAPDSPSRRTRRRRSMRRCSRR